MKTRLFTLLLIVVFSLGACAQKVVVPDAVMKAFSEKYSTVTKVSWEAEDGNFEAEFNLDGIEQSVVYRADGKWIETEVEVKTANLPAAIHEYIKANYEGAELEEAEKVETAEGKVFYEVEVEIEKLFKETEFDLLFDKNGKFLKLEGDDDDDD